MPTHHPPLGSGCDPQYLADVRLTAEKIVAENRSTYRVAAKWLDFYLSDQGGTVKADLNWLRSNYHFSQALDEARKAVERELVNAILAELAGKLTNRQINRIGTNAKHNEPVRAVGPSDLLFASHRSTIEVTPNLVVWKGTPMPTIGGQVQLKWWDIYDWNPNRPYYSGIPIPKPLIPIDAPLFAIDYRDLDALQSCANGGAKVFRVEAKWIATAQVGTGMTQFVSWLGQQSRPAYEKERYFGLQMHLKKLIRWSGF